MMLSKKRQSQNRTIVVCKAEDKTEFKAPFGNYADYKFFFFFKRQKNNLAIFLKKIISSIIKKNIWWNYQKQKKLKCFIRSYF